MDSKGRFEVDSTIQVDLRSSDSTLNGSRQWTPANVGMVILKPTKKAVTLVVVNFFSQGMLKPSEHRKSGVVYEHGKVCADNASKQIPFWQKPSPEMRPED